MPGTTTARHADHTATRRAFRAGFRTLALGACLVAAAGCSSDDDDDDLDDVDGPVLFPGAPGADPFAGVPDLDAPGVGDPDLVDPDLDVPADDDPDGLGLVGAPFAPVDVPGDARNVAGLYDASVRRPLGLDVRYLLITVNDTVVVYDYDQDAYGTGLNCYRAGAPVPFVRDRGDDYLLDGRSVRVARDTLGIGFGFTDTLDDDRDGDFTDFVYYRYPLLSGLSVLDLNRCR